MDTLRATNLSSILTNSNSTNSNSDSSAKSSSKPKMSKVQQQQQQLDKDNVSKLVKTFGELSRHEKILFLINIREFTRDQNHPQVLLDTQQKDCNSHVKQEPVDVVCNGSSESLSEPAATTATSNPPTTPQSLRLSRTSNWLQKTFIQDSQVALPKEEVYSLYKHEFLRLNEKPISTADFGKLMRQVFPDVKARRLGQRGQSKYCYANIRKRSEVEKPALPSPLPQNELVSWAKNKFNIDFGDVSQVVAFLKCEDRSGSGGVAMNQRKRRASCGGNLLKQGGRGSSGGNTKSSSGRSASVSVLELDQNNKEDPMMLLHDNESLEIGSYFENSNNSSNWPQLRSLLTDESSSCSTTTTFGGLGTTFAGIGGATGLGLTSGGGLNILNNKKKRHSSSVQFEFIKPEVGIGALLQHNRSQSVPVTEMSFIRGGLGLGSGGGTGGLDEMQSSSSLFDEFGGGSGAGGSGSNSGVEINNPLFSSAVTGGILHGIVIGGGSSNRTGSGGGSSNCSSSSSVMFESIGGASGATAGGGADLGGTGIGIDVSIGGGGSSSNDVELGGGGPGGGGEGSSGSNGLLLGGSGNDVFFDSVFDLMMSDCQN